MKMEYTVSITLVVIAAALTWWLSKSADNAVTWPLQCVLAGVVLGNSVGSGKKKYWPGYAAGFVIGFGCVAAFYGLIAFQRA